MSSGGGPAWRRRRQSGASRRYPAGPARSPRRSLPATRPIRRRRIRWARRWSVRGLEDARRRCRRRTRVRRPRHDRRSRVAMVNETLARHFWPTGGAVGQRRDVWSSTLRSRRSRARPAVDQRPGAAAQPLAYLNYWQQDGATVGQQGSRARTSGYSGNAEAMLPEIQRAIRGDRPPACPSRKCRRSARGSGLQFASLRAARTMLVTFGALALGLSDGRVVHHPRVRRRPADPRDCGARRSTPSWPARIPRRNPCPSV